MAPDASRPEPVSLGEHNGFDVYPMPMFLTFRVSDVAGSAAWYIDALGFGTMFTMPGDGETLSMAHIRLGKYQDLLLVPGETSGVGETLATLTVQDSTALGDQARAVPAVGLSSIGESTRTPWNTVETLVTDPDGYSFVLSSQGQDEQMGKAMGELFDGVVG